VHGYTGTLRANSQGSLDPTSFQSIRAHPRASRCFSAPQGRQRSLLVWSGAHINSPSTRSDPLYHNKPRGQIAPEHRFFKMVDLGGYQLKQSESPAGWSVDRYPRNPDYLLHTACFLR
jgi:hypothetical protein